MKSLSKLDLSKFTLKVRETSPSFSLERAFSSELDKEIFITTTLAILEESAEGEISETSFRLALSEGRFRGVSFPRSSVAKSSPLYDGLTALGFKVTSVINTKTWRHVGTVISL